VIKKDDIATFASLLEKTIAGGNLDRESIVRAMTNNSGFLFPGDGKAETTTWLCFPSSFGHDEDGNVFVVFDWLYYSEDRVAVMKEMEEFSGSKEVQDLVVILNDLDEKSMNAGNVDAKSSGLSRISTQFGIEDLDSRNPVEIAMKLRHYKDTGDKKFIMKEVLADVKIILSMHPSIAGMMADAIHQLE
jgi:hypothetical protein